MSRLYAKCQVAKPGQMRLTMELTMTIDDWILLKKQLHETTSPRSFPAWHLNDAIHELIDMANSRFEKSYEYGEKEKE